MFELNQKLAEASQKLRLKQKLDSSIKQMEQELVSQQNRLDELQTSLKQEGRDVEKLEGLSLTGLFYTILGSKEAQLEKERQEFLAAKLKFDECNHSIQATREQLSQLQEQLNLVTGADREYQQVLAEKEQAIMASGSEQAKELFQLTESIAHGQANLKELEEAISTGNDVVRGLDAVIRALESAKGWGTWDMLGGGLLSTAVKHSRIEDARQAVHRVQHLLRIFNQELADVDPYLTNGLEVNMSSFTAFADYFFDGLIVDWVIQSKISQSLNNVNSLANKVILTLQNLKENKVATDVELSRLIATREALVAEVV